MKELKELGRLRRELGARILQAIMEAWPAEEPRCEHGCGPGYCPEEDCEFSKRRPLMPTVKRWLIVRADKTMRVVSRCPPLRWDEVAFWLLLTVPRGWGEEIGTVDLTIPEGTVIVVPEEMETPAQEAPRADA